MFESIYTNQHIFYDFNDYSLYDLGEYVLIQDYSVLNLSEIRTTNFILINNLMRKCNELIFNNNNFLFYVLLDSLKETNCLILNILFNYSNFLELDFSVYNYFYFNFCLYLYTYINVIHCYYSALTFIDLNYFLGFNSRNLLSLSVYFNCIVHMLFSFIVVNIKYTIILVF